MLGVKADVKTRQKQKRTKLYLVYNFFIKSKRKAVVYFYLILLDHPAWYNTVLYIIH